MTLEDDLEELRTKANEWLPKDLDKGNGWALNHPIQKLINYKNHLLGFEPPRPPVRAASKRKADPVEQIEKLQKLKESCAISPDEFEAKKKELLAQI